MNIRKKYYNTVLRTFSDQSHLEKNLKPILQELNFAERSRLVFLCNNFFRNFGSLESFMIKFVEPKLEKQDLKSMILILAAANEYIIAKKAKDYAIVNDYVSIAKKRFNKYKAGFINAILRKFIQEHNNYQETFSDIEKNFPSWILKKLSIQNSQEEYERILLFFQSQPQIYLRVNTIKITPDKLVSLLKKENIETERSDIFIDFLLFKSGNLFESSSFQKGLFYIQKPTHALPSYLLDPKPNQTILDICCAPGGKATHLQQLCKNNSELYLNEIAKNKRKLVITNFKRLGLKYKKLEHQDATTYRSYREYDKILIDVPCSGSGNLGSIPELRWNLEEEDIPELQNQQLAILNRMKYYVKLGGSLVYSTCSIFKDENEDVISLFLKNNPDFAIVSPLTNHNVLNNFITKEGSYKVIPSRVRLSGGFCVRLKRIKLI